MIEYTREQFSRVLEDKGYGDTELAMINRWLARGDGAAVYRNQDLGHPELGHVKIVSYGSPQAQLEVDTPPQRLSDGLSAGAINWRYQLEGTYRAGPLTPVAGGHAVRGVNTTGNARIDGATAEIAIALRNASPGQRNQHYYDEAMSLRDEIMQGTAELNREVL
jgi:hypothetical protein